MSSSQDGHGNSGHWEAGGGRTPWPTCGRYFISGGRDRPLIITHQVEIGKLEGPSTPKTWAGSSIPGRHRVP